VSKFEGDLENLVQRQIVERLRTSVYHDSALKKIRIEPLKIQIYERDQAVNILRKTKAQILIWESFIPKEIAYCNVSTSLEQNEGKFVISQFPDIGNLEPAILNQLRSITSRINPIEDQLQTLQGEIGTLRRTVDLLRLRVEGIESRQTSPGTGGKALQVQTSWPDISRQRRIVLSIGINLHRYLPRLEFAVNDAEELVLTLKTSGLQNVQTRLLKDAEATKDGIRRSIDDIIGHVEEDDQVWIFFAGTGFTEGGIGYLIPHDGDPQQLSSSAISIPEVGSWLRRLKSKQVIVISDTCHSGELALALHRGLSIVQEEKPQALAMGSGRVIITAGKADQLALELSALRHGLFSYYLLQGLRGGADNNGDSLVTVSELYAYLSSVVSEKSSRQLTPTLTTSEYSEFALVVLRENSLSDRTQ
jgi:hypothetical protein